jgi:hypothetical protein
MANISGFLDPRPHKPIPVEAMWDEFIQTVNGQKISDLLSKSPSFDNADYLFEAEGIVAELKEVVTEFGSSKAFDNGFNRLMERLISEDPSWRPGLFGGNEKYPNWFYPEFVRIFRPPISRILKKANRQIRETKDYFKKSSPRRSD